MSGQLCIPFFTDHNVADSAGTMLVTLGHQLTRLRDCMLPDTKDPLVALACAEGGHVLVTHDTDFRAISARLNIRQEQFQRLLHRVELKCFEPRAAARLKDSMTLIESEWAIAKATGAAMVIQVFESSIRIQR